MPARPTSGFCPSTIRAPTWRRCRRALRAFACSSRSGVGCGSVRAQPSPSGTPTGASRAWLEVPIRSLPAGCSSRGGLKLPLTVEPGSAPLKVEGTRYPGSLTLRGEQTRLQAIVTVPLERYLVGVVSSECFGFWPQQTLRAQAVASRTYALANLNPAAAFDLHDDDRSQNYLGLAREFPSASAAVAATAGETLLYGGRPIQAFFTASNGGLTRTAEEAWGGTSLPYIVSRVDPFDARSPASDWGPVSVSIDKLRSAFPHVPARIMGAIVTMNAARRAAAVVTLRAADGSLNEIPVSAFQKRLGLRSPYLTVVTDSSLRADL